MSEPNSILDEALSDCPYPGLDATVRAHVAALRAAAEAYGPLYVAALGLAYLELSPGCCSESAHTE